MRLARVTDDLIEPLSEMLQGVEMTFRPFGRTPPELRLSIQPEDEHWVFVDPARVVVAYGMLRGWSEGYGVPSLGLAVRESQRNRGLGGTMIEVLHAVAKARGAKKIRLTVDASNTPARQLYAAKGYVDQGAGLWLKELA
jgi:ribosomal protein S18 acetylase RimI-like enzyme